MPVVARPLLGLVLVGLLSPPVAAQSRAIAPDDSPALVHGLSATLAGAAFSDLSFDSGVWPTAADPTGAVQAGSPHGRRHQWGLGGRTGGFTIGIGGSVRYWRTARWGIQADISRYTAEWASGSAGVLQFSPVALFVLGNPELQKDTQVRPYAGAGLNIFKASKDVVSEGESTTSAGVAVFVGAELVFPQLPNFGASGDIGFYQTGSFGGVDIGGFAITISGHYYIR